MSQFRIVQLPGREDVQSLNSAGGCEAVPQVLWLRPGHIDPPGERIIDRDAQTNFARVVHLPIFEATRIRDNLITVFGYHLRRAYQGMVAPVAR